MDSKVFLRRFFLITLLIIGVFVAFNIYVDVYGLFLGRKDRKVYVNERTSKYLLSFRYIPENYNGIIIGPSLSANLNPDYIGKFKIYNASIMGANISELHYLIRNIVERGNIKIAIICVDPYLTKDFGKKSAAIDPKEYFGALGSTNLLRTYLMYIVRTYNLFPEKYAPDLIDADGWNNFELEMKNLNAEKAIQEKVMLKHYENTAIHPEAYTELKEVLEELRARKINVVAYFSPIPRQIYTLGKDDYRLFEEKMMKLFTTDDIVINLNEERYANVTSDYRYYIDHGHLSKDGQIFVMNEINARLGQIDANEAMPVNLQK